MLLNKLSEEDFVVLRGSLESGRQRPSALSPMLILAIFFQALMFFLAYVVGADKSIFPNQKIMFQIHLVITVILILLSIMYAIPSVFKRMQKTQYLLTILVSQNLFGAFFYIMALSFIGKIRGLTVESLLNFTYVTLLFGVLIVMLTCIRFYILLKKGEYRENSKRDKVRGRFETKSYLPMAIIGGMGLVYIIQYLARNIYVIDVNLVTIILIGPLLFYIMLFVLPEQLIILYCKCRFESFNYEQNGNLKPLGTRKGA